MLDEAKTTREGTRARILHAAFEEFRSNGFQAGSLNQIAERSGTTKGAVFHYFKSKNALGYAVIEEVIQPMGNERWIDPLIAAEDPLEEVKATFRRNIRADIEGGETLKGCPLNSLAQEMSALDEGFRKRIERSYRIWRGAVAAAVRRGIERGQIKEDVSPDGVAALVVANQMGIWGTVKNSHNKELMTRSCEALCEYLDSLRR